MSWQCGGTSLVWKDVGRFSTKHQELVQARNKKEASGAFSLMWWRVSSDRDWCYFSPKLKSASSQELPPFFPLEKSWVLFKSNTWGMGPPGRRKECLDPCLSGQLAGAPASEATLGLLCLLFSPVPSAAQVSDLSCSLPSPTKNLENKSAPYMEASSRARRGQVWAIIPKTASLVLSVGDLSRRLRAAPKGNQWSRGTMRASSPHPKFSKAIPAWCSPAQAHTHSHRCLGALWVPGCPLRGRVGAIWFLVNALWFVNKTLWLERKSPWDRRGEGLEAADADAGTSTASPASLQNTSPPLSSSEKRPDLASSPGSARCCGRAWDGILLGPFQPRCFTSQWLPSICKTNSLLCAQKETGLCLNHSTARNLFLKRESHMCAKLGVSECSPQCYLWQRRTGKPQYPAGKDRLTQHFPKCVLWHE